MREEHTERRPDADKPKAEEHGEYDPGPPCPRCGATTLWWQGAPRCFRCGWKGC